MLKQKSKNAKGLFLQLDLDTILADLARTKVDLKDTKPVAGEAWTKFWHPTASLRCRAEYIREAGTKPRRNSPREVSA